MKSGLHSAQHLRRAGPFVFFGAPLGQGRNKHVQNQEKKPVAQVAFAEKAAPPTVRLLGKAEILAITGVTFPTIWAWMRAGTFPRSRAVGGKSMWRSDEVEQWLAELPVRPLKGDGESTGVAR